MFKRRTHQANIACSQTPKMASFVRISEGERKLRSTTFRPNTHGAADETEVSNDAEQNIETGVQKANGATLCRSERRKPGHPKFNF